MIKFETINGTLCRMVEPEPLTEFSHVPCVIRRKQGVLTDILTEYSTNPTMSILGELFEIIGYPVVDGSAEWALWQHINGNVLSNPKHGLFRWKYRSDSTAWDCIKVYQDGLIIDSEPEESHPKRWVCFECGVKDSRKGHFYDCKRTGSPIVKQAEKPVSDATQPCEVCDGIGMISCEACNATGLVPITQTAYAVGNWVEYFDNAKLCHAQITEIDSDYCAINPVAGWDKTLQRIRTTCITRKLDHSEVIVHIGCLSGTVQRRSYFDTDKFFSLRNPEMEMAAAVINIDALDAPTRNLVKDLLEKQGEGK